MPKATWQNLPEEKRQRIMEVAVTEFGRRGFSSGSLNVIAGDAGVAKGSLFQYFDDKRDFYSTICKACSTEIAENTIGGLDLDKPFFELLREMARTWLAFFRANPDQQRMAVAAANEIDPDARVDVRRVANAEYDNALRPLVERAIEDGEIRSGVDASLVVSMVTLVFRHLDSAPFDAVGDPAFPFSDLSDEAVDHIAINYVDALQRAFGPHEATSH